MSDARRDVLASVNELFNKQDRKAGKHLKVELKPFFSRRVYLRDDADLTRLCLAIIAPAVGTQVFESVYLWLTQSHRTSKCQGPERRLLRSWILAFQNGYRHESRLPGESWKFGLTGPDSDTHFVQSMFNLFSRQYGPVGRRVGQVDCAALRVECLGPTSSGPSPFSRKWANAKARERRAIRRVNQLAREIEIYG